MSSNILLDPIPELTEVLRTNAFGILPSSHVIIEISFPNTEEDKASIREESAKSGLTSERVVARAKIGLLEGGEIEVTLDRRGYTVSQAAIRSSHPIPSTACLPSQAGGSLNRRAGEQDSANLAM